MEIVRFLYLDGTSSDMSLKHALFTIPRVRRLYSHLTASAIAQLLTERESKEEEGILLTLRMQLPSELAKQLLTSTALSLPTQSGNFVSSQTYSAHIHHICRGMQSLIPVCNFALETERWDMLCIVCQGILSKISAAELCAGVTSAQLFRQREGDDDDREGMASPEELAAVRAVFGGKNQKING